MGAAASRDGVTFVGHATLLIELDGARVITDPLLRTGLAHVRRRVPLPELSALLPLDAVLISHAHADHLDPMSLRRLARDCPVIAPRGCAGILRRSGVREVIEVDEGDRVDAGGILVEAVPALHDGRRYPIGPPVPALGFLLEASTRMYFAGDTDLFDGMAALEGRVDLAALPIWGWGPRIPAGHLDPESAAQAAALIRPAAVLPIHWGTLRSIGAQRDTDPMAPVHRFVAATGRLAPQTEVRVLAPGERMSLAARPARSAQ